MKETTLLVAALVPIIVLFIKKKRLKKSKKEEAAACLLPLLKQIKGNTLRYVSPARVQTENTKNNEFKEIMDLIHECSDQKAKHEVYLPKRLSSQIDSFLSKWSSHCAEYTSTRNYTEPGNVEYFAYHTQKDVDRKREIVRIVEKDMIREFDDIVNTFKR
ncbi:hypothetical protein [Bacteroides reticulotermitis]|uniref:hypothetical protein n=1 Tax=Bacteroides reticulotermitis TaxID=1133319 RepID=UPI003A84D266